ncbi:MAG: helix-turn-helix domain-containing protein [Blastocatellia bacterium]
MDFYVIIVPALALSLCMLLNLLVLKRRDKHLFAELQQSEDIIPIIREKLLNISKEERRELTEFTRATDKNTIDSLVADPVAQTASKFTRAIGKKTLISIAELGSYIKRKRESERLTLKAAAKQTQVSASTLSRIENGAGIPDTPTLARLAKWLGIPFERIARGGGSKESPIVYYPQESVPDIAHAYLRADPNLTPDQARALEDMLRIAYNELSNRAEENEAPEKNPAEE